MRQLMGLILLPALLLGNEVPITRPDIPPQPRSRPAPEYPKALREQHITGAVILRGVVDENGDTKELTVDFASKEEFGRAAIAAVERWKYSPASKAGSPCSVRVEIPVSFGLTRQDLVELDTLRQKEKLPPGPPVCPVEELDEWPELKKEIRPVTPDILKQERRIGQAVMALIIDEQGVPRDIHPLITTHTECVKAAAAVIAEWRFKPGRKGEQMVRTELEVTLVFFPEDHAASGLRVRPGVRSGEGFDRLPVSQREAQPLTKGSTWPKPIKQAPPEYPREMSTRWKSGRVAVEFIIDAKGRVTHVRSDEKANTFFAAMAERAVSQWQFRPATRNGAPVACRVNQLIEFGMDR